MVVDFLAMNGKTIQAVLFANATVAIDLRQRGQGRILQVASISAYQPAPLYAAYVMAKAYVLSFSEVLNEELKPHNVQASLLSSGVTRTEFLQVAGQPANWYPKLTSNSAKPVVQLGIHAMRQGKVSVVAGLFNKIMVQSLPVMPRKLQAKVAHFVMQGKAIHQHSKASA